jgi:hypothetical protein
VVSNVAEEHNTPIQSWTYNTKWLRNPGDLSPGRVIVTAQPTPTMYNDDNRSDPLLFQELLFFKQVLNSTIQDQKSSTLYYDYVTTLASLMFIIQYYYDHFVRKNFL